jgi:thiol-disulfide isomerase/thioredoxin
VLKRFAGLVAAMLVVTPLHTVASPVIPLPAPMLAGASVSSASNSVAAIDLTGKAVDPFELAEGKPVVLIFVRTDCPISNRYAPTIRTLSQKYIGAAMMMLVYPDKTETSANIKKHLQEYGYKLAALQDPQHALVKLGKVEITPEVAVFNSKRELIYHGRIDNWYKEFGHARSAPTTHELDDAIQSALNSQHPAPVSVSGVGCYISDLQ